MSAPGDIEPAVSDLAETVRLVAASAVVVLAAYTITLAIAWDMNILSSLSGGLANTVPVVLFGLVAYRIVCRWIVGRPLAITVIGHLVVGMVFALLSYWLLLVLLGLAQGVSATEFNVRPFDRRALAWQTLQNLTTYGIIAGLAHLKTRRLPASLFLSGPVEAEPTGGPLSRYFIRSGEDIRPIDVDAIVCITGADDYAEVSTTQGQHLVRMTLADLESALPAGRFLRIHRSHIVNVDRIARAEPAGNGRMLLHMETGQMITASRAGTRLLRDRVL